MLTWVLWAWSCSLDHAFVIFVQNAQIVTELEIESSRVFWNMAAPATSSVRHRAGATEIQEYEFIDFSIPDEDLSTITLGQVLGLRGSDTIINDDRDDAALLTKHKSPITMTGGISSSREYSRRHQDADRQNRAER